MSEDLPQPYYSDSHVTIYCGDCAELLPRLGRFDLLLTDPPYGIGASGGVGLYGTRKFKATDSRWDTHAPQALVQLAVGLCEKAVVWGGNYFSLPPSRNFFVWDKGEGFYGRKFAECEQAWVSWDGTPKLFKRDPLAHGDYKKGRKLHPTQKPAALIGWCLAEAGELETILDPFAGVCTTGRVAKDFRKKCICIEREERYCELGALRMAQEVLAL